MKLQVTRFPNHNDTNGTCKKESWEDICQEPFTHYPHKDDQAMWAFKVYENNSRKSGSPVSFYTAVAVDFDNKGDDGKCLSSPTRYEDISHLLEDYNHLAHSTYRNSPSWPRWRLIIPLASPITPQAYLAAYREILYLLGNPAGTDASITRDNVALYRPSYNGVIGWKKFIIDRDWWQPEFGEIQQIDFYAPLPPKNIGGRHDMLVYQAGGSWVNSNKTAEETATELLIYDRDYHNPPYFTDPSEKLKGHTPEEKALFFVESVWKSNCKGLTRPPIIEIFSTTELKESPPPTSFELPPELLTPPPGLVKDIATWITNTAFLPQPAYSLGAALSLVAVLRSHVVKLGDSSYPALLIMNVGKTSSGKNWPMEAMFKILGASNRHGLIHGRPASEAGLEDLIIDEKVALCQIDEFGAVLSSILGKNALPHQEGLAGRIMDIWSATARLYIGRRRAQEPAKRVHQPHLSILGTSTPEHLYKLLGNADVVNGFVPRWFFFMAPEKDPPFNRNRGDLGVPTEITEAIEQIPTPIYDNGIPKIAKHITISKDISLYIYEKVQELRLLASNRGDDNMTRAMLGKVIENSLRMCSVVEEKDTLNIDTFSWTYQITKYSALAALHHIEKEGGESAYEIDCNKILNVIENAGKNGIIRKDISNNRKVRPISSKLRKEIIDDLLQREQIAQATNEDGKPCYVHAKFLA